MTVIKSKVEWAPIPGKCIDIDGDSWHKNEEHCIHCGFGIDPSYWCGCGGYWGEPVVWPDLMPDAGLAGGGEGGDGGR